MLEHKAKDQCSGAADENLEAPDYFKITVDQLFVVAERCLGLKT